MTYEQITLARGLATPIPQTQRAADKSPLMQIQYIPTLGTGGTAATCRVSGTTMTFEVDAAAPTGADRIGTLGVIDLTDTTFTDGGDYDCTAVGGVLDCINGHVAYRAYLIGALRADAATMLINTVTASIIGDHGLTIYADTSGSHGAIVPGTAGVYEIVTTAISGERFINNGVNGHVKDADDACENTLLHASINVNDDQTTVDGGLILYSANQTDKEVVLLGALTVTSATEINLGHTGSSAIYESVGGPFIQAKRGERLIIRVATVSSFADAVAKFDILGTTAVLRGNRIIEDLNFTA